MSLLQSADNYVGAVNAGYTAGGTTLVVASATGLPAILTPQSKYYLIVKAESSNTQEVFLVTGRSSTTLTVVGAQAGTSASNHSSGAVVIGTILTAGGLQLFKREVADIFSDTREYGTVGSNYANGQTFNNGSEVTLLDLSSLGSPGYVSMFQFFLAIS